MTGIDYFAWFVFIVIIVASLVVFVALAQLPGKIAKGRNHPQAEAINVAGWLGLLLTFGIVWALAMIWAFTKPMAVSGENALGADDTTELKARIARLEAQLESVGGSAR